MAFVLDASVTLSWHFDDEEDGVAEQIARQAFLDGVAVPHYWAVEVANGLLRGERRQRTSTAATARFFERLGDLDIKVDMPHPQHTAEILLPLARAHRLSIYDAGYLELAERDGLALATSDKSLAEAARRVGVHLVGKG